MKGVEGLLEYLKSNEAQVMKTFSYKLLGYALGRTILLSDQPLIERLTQAGGEMTFSKLAAEIVTSRQFRYRRETGEHPPAGGPPVTPQQTAIPPVTKEAASANPAKKGAI